MGNPEGTQKSRTVLIILLAALGGCMVAGGRLRYSVGSLARKDCQSHEFRSLIDKRIQRRDNSK